MRIYSVRGMEQIPEVARDFGMKVIAGAWVSRDDADTEREIAGLRRFKDDVTEVRDGFECGINLGSFNDLQIGDLIATYEMREKPRKP